MKAADVAGGGDPALSETFYLLSFASTHDGVAVKMRLRGKVPFTILPTPRGIHASCGISIRLAGGDYPRALELLAPLALDGARLLVHRMTGEIGHYHYEPLE